MTFNLLGKFATQTETELFYQKLVAVKLPPYIFDFAFSFYKLDIPTDSYAHCSTSVVPVNSVDFSNALFLVAAVYVAAVKVKGILSVAEVFEWIHVVYELSVKSRLFHSLESL